MNFVVLICGVDRGSSIIPDYYLSTGEKFMNNQRYSPEFKGDAARQVIERGYIVAEVASNLGYLSIVSIRG